MILADKILNLRKKNGWSQEDLAYKLNVSRQSISKWEGAQAIPDINKIIEMAKLFNVTTDYLLKDDIEDITYTDENLDNEDKSIKKISLNETNEYFSTAFKAFGKISIGVWLCIISPIVIIILSGMADKNYMQENVAAAIGLSYLFMCVAIAVFLFIKSGIELSKYNYLKENNFELEYGVSGIIKDKKEKIMKNYGLTIALAVTGIVLGAFLIVVVSLLTNDSLLACISVGIFLGITAISVYFITYSSLKKSACEQLLKEGDYKQNNVEKNQKQEKFAGFYWPIITAVYLLWSFLSRNWNITWLIWPISALVFAAISSIITATNK